MAGPHTDTDVLILGAGPAGSSTAIWCLKKGLSVTILDRDKFPRNRPGETLHPGVEVILRSLDVFEQVLQSTTIRHRGITVQSKSETVFIPYGRDDKGEWRGFQVLRSKLDSCLIQKAIALGAKVNQPIKISKLIIESGRVMGIMYGDKEIRARFVVDATGHTQWLSKQLNLDVVKQSPTLLARYGYTKQQDHADEPSFSFNETGWEWSAKISDGLCQWTEVTFIGAFPHSRQKDSLEKIKGADVTWRYIPNCAGPGYFLVGDAATILDPAASRGVLRAMYSGVMAADAIIKIDHSYKLEDKIIQGYCEWLHDWFIHDCNELRKLYRQHGCSI